jgi:N-acylneuraminate cytidylyltransferase
MGGVVGFIFARGGSKGVPRKNLREVAGKPLLARAVQAGLAARRVERVVVSTDDAEIAEAARAWGAETPFLRPAELAGDRSPEWLAWRHALEQVPETETFLCIPTTSPLRLASDLDAAVERLEESGADLVVTVRPAARNPWFNQVVLGPDGMARRVMDSLGLAGPVATRQEAPPVWDLTTVAYAARPAYVLAAEEMFQGRVAAVEVPEERALDIDTELDLAVADFLLRRREEGP